MAVARKAIVKMPVEAQATEALRQDIVSGALKAGERLTEMKLAADLGLSRATIRTALHQLAKEGLIVQTPYTGWAVVSLTAQSAWELYTLRSALEGLAARLANEAMNAAGRKTLASAFSRLTDACGRGDADAIADADFSLHKTIISLAGHSRLELQYRIVEQQVKMYIRCSDELVPHPAEIVEQHRSIVDSILSGTPDEAARASENHNLQEGRILVGRIEQSVDFPQAV
ncbi:GntR family transcriptional regulator [Xanthobacter sp. VNH20]|uniref:GntR family transcriptional regulator n=1 Tax=Xanthobacter sp. VNH20 TaxID=3156616 RepID=UPI0032B464DC